MLKFQTLYVYRNNMASRYLFHRVNAKFIKLTAYCIPSDYKINRDKLDELNPKF